MKQPYIIVTWHEPDSGTSYNVMRAEQHKQWVEKTGGDLGDPKAVQALVELLDGIGKDFTARATADAYVRDTDGVIADEIVITARNDREAARNQDVFRFRDQTGEMISIGDRLKLVDMAGPRLGGGDRHIRYLIDLEGEVVGLDTIGDDGKPKGLNSVWVRIDGDTAIASVHPARTRVIPKAAK